MYLAAFFDSSVHQVMFANYSQEIAVNNNAQKGLLLFSGIYATLMKLHLHSYYEF
jgi:hypothetical protein